MILDRNKGISSINYNHLNLPRSIVFNENQQTSIHYTYNSAGQKVKKAANLGTTNNVSGTSFTEYFGGFQYNNDVLQFFPHAQGYVKHTVNPSNGASEFDYVYQYKDHLGNIRINYTFDTATSSLRVLEENHYYPFGLKHQENLQTRSIRFAPSTFASNEWIKGVGFFEQPPMAALVPNSGYQYKFQGQERQDELGLNWDSFKWRNYSPNLGRFWSIDPLADIYVYNSTYAFAENKLGLGIELEGLEIIPTYGMEYSNARTSEDFERIQHMKNMQAAGSIAGAAALIGSIAYTSYGAYCSWFGTTQLSSWLSNTTTGVATFSYLESAYTFQGFIQTNLSVGSISATTNLMGQFYFNSSFDGVNWAQPLAAGFLKNPFYSNLGESIFTLDSKGFGVEGNINKVLSTFSSNILGNKISSKFEVNSSYKATEKVLNTFIGTGVETFENYLGTGIESTLKSVDLKGTLDKVDKQFSKESNKTKETKSQ